MKRRSFLAAGVSAGVVLAGCAGNSDGSSADGSGGNGDGTPTPTATPDDSPTLDTHPAATGLEGQPTLGPDPAEAPAVIVAYEDPSCPRCASFETEVVPQLRSEHVESGDLSLAFRGYPVVYEWGQPATRALEAAYDRSADAHWALAEHYFRSQDDFRYGDLSEVYPKTERVLDEATDIDGKTVVREAEDGVYDDAVQTDLDAGQAAGAGQTTPHLFLFRDGVYQTKASGYVSVDVITSALQL
ncbi:MAG: thioredoxin domain-containing protein [Haloarculaceae archaeon]